jgi:hypothetical protein
MSEAIEQPREDVTAPETPASADDLDSLLAEYDSKVTPEPVPATGTDADISGNAPTDQPLDQQTWEELLGPSPRVAELEGELTSVRQQERDRQSRSDFEGFAKKLQADLGNPNIPEDFARTTLLAMSVEKPELQVAWQYRHLTSEQRRAADLEFQQLEALYWKAQQAPDDPRKAEALAQMERRGQELGLMMNAGKILDRAWRDVQKRAEKVLPAIDSEVTATRMEVAQLIRDGGSGREPPPMPQVQLGSLDTQEYRRHVRETYGFDPNV